MNDNEPKPPSLADRLARNAQIVAALNEVADREFAAVKQRSDLVEKHNLQLSRRLSSFQELPTLIAQLSFVSFILVFVVGLEILRRQWMGQPDLALFSCTLAILMVLLVVRNLEKRFGGWRLGPGLKFQFVPGPDGLDDYASNDARAELDKAA